MKRQRRWICLESYNDILERMLDTYEEESGFRPEKESDIMLRLRVLAGEIYQENAHAEYILRQMFPTTASGEYLEAHAAQRGLSRKHGTKAMGRLIFAAENETHDNILIPAGTEVCTTDELLRFVTDSDAVLTSNAQTVMVKATAAEIGSAYNVRTNSIGVLVTPVIGIASVNNNAGFTGGMDDESDELLRERVAESYRYISNGANAAYYRSIAYSVDGVYSASAVGCSRGVGTVDVYACDRSGNLSAEKIHEIQALLNEKREVNVDVRAYVPTPLEIDLYIRLKVADGYDFDTVAEKVRVAVTNYINDLGIGKNLWLSDVGEVIYHTEGVSGYRFLESYGSDREVPLTRYAKAGMILVRNE